MTQRRELVISKEFNLEIIAEIGVNHNGSISRAYQLIDEALLAGADTVKFQTYKASRLASPNTPKVPYQSRDTQRKTHYSMLKALELSSLDFKKIFKHCQQAGINFLSTPYSIADIELLCDLGVRRFKTSSADLVDHQMHEYLAEKHLDCIVSTGMSTDLEIEDTLACYAHSTAKITLMHCTSQYPTPDKLTNIRRVAMLFQLFSIPVGYSDHSLGTEAATLALGFGAPVIEKHFTLNRADTGPDHSSSLEPDDFKFFAQTLRAAELCLKGDGQYVLTAEEVAMRQVSRKSLRAIRPLKKGHKINLKDLVLMRPAGGLLYQDRGDLLGKCLIKDVPQFGQILPEDLET